MRPVRRFAARDASQTARTTPLRESLLKRGLSRAIDPFENDEKAGVVCALHAIPSKPYAESCRCARVPGLTFGSVVGESEFLADALIEFASQWIVNLATVRHTFICSPDTAPES